MNQIDIEAWVASAPIEQRAFREAVHIVLDAIGHSRDLRVRMVMKGGLLLAIRYDSSRFTRDLNFSTAERYSRDSAENLLATFQAGLAAAEARLVYDTTCRLQSSKVEPKGEGKTHHNLALTIGFAGRSRSAALARLRAGQASQVLRIDYSFNEAVFDVEILELDGGATIHSYTLHNVLAEKLRSLLQQPVRRRYRRQDVYDIWLLLQSGHEFSADDLARTHRMFIESCRSRGIEPTRSSIDDESVVRMAEEGYGELQDDVDGELPSFGEALAVVRGFYLSMPWL